MATNGGLWASLGRMVRGQYHSATATAAKASPWVEDDGLAYIDTSAWMGANAHGDLMRNDRGYAEAYMSIEWAFRAINVRTVMIADVLRDAHLVDVATGKEADTDIIERAFDRSYRLFGNDVYADWCFNKAVYGEAYIEIVRNAFNIPQTVRVLNSLAVEPEVVRGEIVRYVYQGDAGVQYFERGDIVFDKQRHASDDTRGYSLLAAALNAVNIERQLVLVTHRHLRNNMRPGLIFTPGENKLTEQDAEFLKRTLRSQASGSENTGKPLFIPIPMNVTTAEPPKFEDQATLGETQKRKICSAIGVPVALVDYADMAYQLSPEQRRTLYDLTIRPEARNIARVIDVQIRPRLDMGARYRFEINNDKLDFRLSEPRDLADLAKSRYEAGLVTMNDARAAQGLEPVDGGDVYLMPTGRIAVPAAQLPQLPTLMAQAGMPALPPESPAAAPAPTPEPAPAPAPAVTEQTPVTLPAKADTPPDAPQSDASDEIRAFIKAALNNRKRAIERFEFYHTPVEMAAVLRAEADEAENLKAWGADVLLLAIKGEIDYARSLRALVRGLWRGVVSEFDFVDGFYSAIRREYRKAFELGVEDGGDTYDNLSDQQKQRLEVLINSELAHVPGYKDAIVEADQAKGGNLDPLLSRVSKWTARLNGIRAVGKLVALGDKRQKWVYDPAKEHCFVAGTMVETLDGPKPIETIQSGDVVATGDGYHLVIEPMVNVYDGGELYEIEQNGRVVQCTPNHPFLTQRGWIRAEDLRATDYIISLEDVRYDGHRHVTLPDASNGEAASVQISILSRVAATLGLLPFGQWFKSAMSVPVITVGLNDQIANAAVNNELGFDQAIRLILNTKIVKYGKQTLFKFGRFIALKLAMSFKELFEVSGASSIFNLGFGNLLNSSLVEHRVMFSHVLSGGGMNLSRKNIGIKHNAQGGRTVLNLFNSQSHNARGFNRGTGWVESAQGVVEFVAPDSLSIHASSTVITTTHTDSSAIWTVTPTPTGIDWRVFFRALRATWFALASVSGVSTADTTEPLSSSDLSLAQFAATSCLVLHRRSRLSIRRISTEIIPVYNLSVHGEHQYFANGLLAHNCGDCNNLNGRVYKASTWERWGIHPQSPKLECFGTNCGCGFEDTDEPITRGRPPRLHGKAMKAIAADAIPDAEDGYAYLDLSHSEEIRGIQKELKYKIGDEHGIDYQDMPTYHVTLLYAPQVADDALSALSAKARTVIPSLRITTGRVFTFPGEHQNAVVLEVAHNDDVDAFQRTLYEFWTELGVEMSEYSKPEDWKPHITLAYVPTDMMVEFEPESLSLTVSVVIVGRDEYEAVEVIATPIDEEESL